MALAFTFSYPTDQTFFSLLFDCSQGASALHLDRWLWGGAQIQNQDPGVGKFASWKTNTSPQNKHQSMVNSESEMLT